MLLHELVKSDYIYYDPEIRVYYPGLKLIQIGAICLNNTNVSREISIGIKRLSDDLGETTHAGILDGRHIVYIAKHPGSRDLSIVATIGYRLPAHATAIGKVLLSQIPEADLAARLRAAPLERFTDNTITDIGLLLDELRQVAKRGYAIDNQEIIPGGICVAAPIVDKANKIVAAVSVTLAASRVQNGDFMAVIIDKVGKIAEHVSMRLGKI
jgi:DNA-binding IclR family transcriptional regulator